MKEGYSDSIKKEENFMLETLEAIDLQEEILLKTKPRNIWFREGEKNDIYFSKTPYSIGNPT